MDIVPMEPLEEVRRVEKYTSLHSRFLGLHEVSPQELPEMLLVGNRLIDKVEELKKDNRIPRRFFEKNIQGNVHGAVGKDKTEKKEDMDNKRTRVAEDPRIPLRFFKKLHTPVDIFEIKIADKAGNGDLNTAGVEKRRALVNQYGRVVKRGSQ